MPRQSKKALKADPMQQTNLSAYNNFPYHPGGSLFKRTAWFYINAVLFKTSMIPFSGLKVYLLRLFGASIGKGVNIKPGVNIKYPWLLSIGDHSWIGENVWIDNLVTINIGKNVCVSQGALLLTGNHNYKVPAFNLMTGQITLEDGVWIGAGAIVNQGITASSHSILTAGSIATKNLEPYFIYQGNPALKTRPRLLLQANPSNG
jgi:putative colanic acid biosynthesis acetyltransferase WcaF